MPSIDTLNLIENLRKLISAQSLLGQKKNIKPIMHVVAKEFDMDYRIEGMDKPCKSIPKMHIGYLKSTL